MWYVLYFCILVNITSCIEVEISTEVHKSLDYVLCRHCGNNILTTDSIISKLSPTSVHSFNDTIFNKDEVLVQVLSKDNLLEIPIVTSTRSSCLGIGEWEEDDDWFPGYQWKTCVCSECGIFMGWIFQPIDPFYRFTCTIPWILKMTTTALSKEDEEFLAECEEEFKDRFTEKDEEFMKVHTAVPSDPPIIENWYVPNSSGRRHDRRHHRPYNASERRGGRGRQRGLADRRPQPDPRGYNDYHDFYDNRQRRRYQ